MDKNELARLQDYVKSRYDECGLDYKTFNQDIDTDLAYAEQKNIITAYLDGVLPKVIPKLKRDCEISKAEEKAKQEALLKTEKEKIEKERLEQEAKMIEELEKNPSIDFIKDKIEREFNSFAIGEKNLLYIYGTQGTSKTTSLRHIFLEREYKEEIDFVFVGYTPANKLYEKFKNYTERGIKFIVLDDAQGVFKNDVSRGMFLQAIDDKKIRNIYYDGSAKPLSPIMDFKPKVIFISNEMIAHENILSRARIVQILLNYPQRLKYAEKILKNKGADEKELKEIMEHIKEKTIKKKIAFDFRVCKELLEDYRNNPKWKEKTILDERTTILLQCLDNNIGTEGAIENFSLRTGLSRRMGYYLLKDLEKI